MTSDKCPHAAAEPSPVPGPVPATPAGPSVAIPTPRHRLPVLGDLLSVDPAKPVQKEMRMAAELGPIFERKIVNQRLVVVSGVDLVSEVNDESTWAKSLGQPIRKLRGIAEDGLFTAFSNEPNWAKAHNILNPGFSQAALRGYHGSMLRALDGLRSAWDGAAATGRPVDVARDMNRLTLDVIGLAGFGYDFGSFTKTEDPFVTAMSRALAHVNRTSNDLPFVRKLFGRKAAAQHRADIALMRSVVDDVIAERSRNPGGHDDLLDLMLSTVDPACGEPLDPVNIRNQVITFLVAGNETTAGTLGFALYYLTKHPEIAATARAEIEMVASDGGPLSFDQVGKLRYLRRVVDETLRLWPAAPGYFRKVRVDTVLGGRYPMPLGSWVFVLLPQLHRDPVWGNDTETFDPDRFLPEQVRKRPRDAYRPFGTGPRSCIGRQFALHEAVLTLAELLRRYEFEADPTYSLDIQEAVTLKPRGLTLRVRSR
ncbi:cytochrome P450 [Rhodococcus sp. NPDC127528]|uniref:cytochrome P450 n=1 Tax=unclassified Rhodococcus (in: high G+C Gram-positive bacteria) TaxID=192944 RepID=UPI00362FF807